ncbi:hypothetical protein Fot_28427 [Forsythia ovata]|uniref:Uncharacterized protein n=1 Tax=Forsythia ovata TaxID=205694 RepID=A0ABD1TNY9_9LAMI
MAGFYFSKLPKFKIMSERVINAGEDIPPMPRVPCTASVPATTVSLTSGAATNAYFSVSLDPKVTADISSALHLKGSLLPSEKGRRPNKGKWVGSNEREAAKANKGLEDDDSVADSQKAKRGRQTSPREVGGSISHPRGVARTSISHLHGWAKHINIGSRQDKLDLAILEKLPVPTTWLHLQLFPPMMYN